MKGKCAIAALAFMGLPALAANFSGKWAIEPPAGRGSRGGPIILILNQVGNEVTGTITPRLDPGTSSPLNVEILGGRVEGDVISFYVWTGNDQPAKTMYRGRMAASGDQIEFTTTAGGSAGGLGSASSQGGPQTNATPPTPAGQAQPGSAAGRGQPAGQQQLRARRTK